MLWLRSLFRPQSERPWTAINDRRLTLTGDGQAGHRLFDPVWV